MASISSDLFIATTFWRMLWPLGKPKAVEIKGIFFQWRLDFYLECEVEPPSMGRFVQRFSGRILVMVRMNRMHQNSAKTKFRSSSRFHGRAFCGY
jgi:hypothetical protein